MVVNLMLKKLPDAEIENKASSTMDKSKKRKGLIIICVTIVVALITGFAFLVNAAAPPEPDGTIYVQGILDESQMRLLADLHLANDLKTLIEFAVFVEECQVVVNRNIPSASVVLRLKSGHEILSNEEAEAIFNIISGTISGIKKENILLTDSEMNYYGAHATFNPED